MARCSNIIHAIHTKDIEEFGRSITIDHVAEPVRKTSIPKYDLIKEKILEAGAFGCNISGGGSSVFAVCKEENQDRIYDIMKDGFSNDPNYVEVIKTKTSNIGVKRIE